MSYVYLLTTHVSTFKIGTKRRSHKRFICEKKWTSIAWMNSMNLKIVSLMKNTGSNWRYSTVCSDEKVYILLEPSSQKRMRSSSLTSRKIEFQIIWLAILKE